MPNTAAIIVAAGKGIRAGGGLPKQYRLLGGQSVLRRTVQAFTRHCAIDEVIVVIAAGDTSRARETLNGLDVSFVTGGETRTLSVRAGLAAVSANADAVLIHDGARAFVSASVISAVIDALSASDGALPALPVADALWSASNNQTGAPVSRDGLYRAQTPQGFRLAAIRKAYEDLDPDAELADDVAVARAAGIEVQLVPGDEENFKLTLPEDFDRAERLLNAGDCVTGNGFDVHRLEPADHMMLCGVRIEHGLGLAGHSDADAGLHAITDALLGAIAAGDIGQHFPPTDPRWKGASSDQFLKHAVSLAHSAGAKLVHADLTVICERPKIGPHREVMRSRLAELLGLPIDRVSVKATTTEGLGFTGRREGLAAQATVTVRR